MEQAACRGQDPEMFFPLRPSGRFDPNHPPSDVEAPAKRICATCPVRQECLAYGMANEAPSYRWGIYGGLSAAERRGVKQRPNPAAQPHQLAPCGTLSAYSRHIRRKEPVCEPCQEAARAHQRDYVRRRRDNGGLPLTMKENP